MNSGIIKVLFHFSICILFLNSCGNSEKEKTEFEYPRDKFDELFVTAKKSILQQFVKKTLTEFEHIDYSINIDTGIFVRLRRFNKERGCVSFIKGVGSPKEAVKTAAVNAAFFDPRHKHISEKELNDLEIEITIIDRLERIKDFDDFILGKQTVFIKRNSKKAILQAQAAAERNYSKEDYLKAICRKAGMNKNAYRENNTEIYRANTVFMKKMFRDINTGM